MPDGTARISWRLLTSNPALVSSTSDKLTCAATSTVLARRVPLDVRVSCWRASIADPCIARHAEARLKTMPTASASAIANARTRTSGVTSSPAGTR